MDEEIIDKLKSIVIKNYDSEFCAATSQWSMGNYDDVFYDGERSGRSWLAYEIGSLIGMGLEEPQEPEYEY